VHAQWEALGFEIYFSSAADVLATYPHLSNAIGSRDVAITFVFGGHMEELACALIVSAALAKNFGAVVHYPADDILYSVDQLIGDARSVLREIP
jgi:hypothetical protein